MKQRKPADRKPNVLLVFQTRRAEARAVLGGIANYESTHADWATFLDDEAQSERHRDWLKRKAWDGAISLHTTPSFAAECRELGVPLVDLCDQPALPGVSQIRPDNVAIGQMGAEHFIERGYRHLAYCGYSNQDWSVERRRGFVEGACLAGFPCAVSEQPHAPGHDAPDWEQNQMFEIAGWIAGCPQPLAIMACHDRLAIQVMQACEHLDLVVPEEVAVLGVDDDAIRCELSYPPLSSVATNRFFSGYAAAELLDKMMSGANAGPVQIRVEPTRVILRHSTDILAIEDKAVASALKYIRDNACLGITIAGLLGTVGASRSQLEKKFRRYIGRSPRAEIRRVQMTRAKQLLLETDFPLKKIAELVGYEHPEYLSVVFKRTTEMSPGSYRRRIQAGADGRLQGSGPPAKAVVKFSTDKKAQFKFPKAHTQSARKII